MICHYFSEPTYIFFDSELPVLLYYSHIPVAILALGVGLFLFLNNPKELPNRLLFALTATFSAWTIINLFVWTNIHSDFLLSLWSLYGVAEGLISVLSIYFIHTFVLKRDLQFYQKVALLILLLPVFIFSHTDLNVSGFQISDCDAFGFEGALYNAYYTSLSLIAILWNTITLAKGYRATNNTSERKKIILVGVGIQLFLLIFFSVVWLASFLTTQGWFEHSNFEFFGMFGMAFFMVFIGVLVAKFKAFKVGVLAAQVLLVAQVFLVGSQITVATNNTALILSSLTLVLTLTVGLMLNRSIKKEAKHLETLEILTTKLATANERLRELDKAKSEFVSIASHQLRSPLTAIRGYASMLAEGSFGQLPVKAAESAKRIEDSAKLMAMSIEDYLNVSRIESGNMKYNLSDFNLVDMTSKLCDDLRPEAMSRNLILLFRSNVSGKGIVNADVGKTNQIIHNLVNNSIKYTPKGSVSVFVRDDVKTKRIYIDITDTGIGMSKETIDKLFGKFSRANNANSVNTSGTGLGLYVALKMAEAMGGTISCTSEGDGKGSTFTFELPVAM